MKSRISGKEIRSEYKTYKSNGKDCIYLEDMFHVSVMHFLRLTDDEYDMLLSKITGDEEELLIGDNPSFGDKRKILAIINRVFKNEN